MSCVKYLVHAVSLIPPDDNHTARQSEVVKGYHGFCSYASKHVVDHLVTYLKLDQGSVQSEFRDSLLQAAESLAALVQQYAPYKKRVVDDRLIEQYEMLKERPMLFSLVVSERALVSRTSTRARREIPGQSLPADEASR